MGARIRKYWQAHPKFWRGVLLAMVIIVIGAVILLEFLSRGAAVIFNHEMQEQDMLRGTITADKILADLTGHVMFEHLVWKNPDGVTILEVPSGSLQVRPWDIVTKNIKSTTIQAITLNDAQVSLRLADDMQVDFVRQSRDMNKLEDDPEDKDWRNKVSLTGKSEEERKAIGEWRRKRQAARLQKRWDNFNRQGRKIRTKLTLANCRMEVFFKDRHYLMDHVELQTDINTNDKMKIKLETGGFGGTMIGNGIRLNGEVDFTAEDIPVCDLWLRFIDVDPSSLDMGVNIHDKMTLDSHISGPLTTLSGEGHVQMDELHIPGLDFSNVIGDLYYDGEDLLFKDVTADVFGGKLVAEGTYDLDTRYYQLQGHGSNLQTAKALPGSSLYCSVDMDVNMYSRGSSRETTVWGSFASQPGFYKLLPFNKLAGKFTNEYRNLTFNDVVMELPGFTAKTDSLSIKQGKLAFAPIHLFDEKGQPLTVIENYR
ncbi:hypothetical protein SAMN02910356_00246 [Selenomonas sp. GACV-9]|uniref:hypothetical protein n=1 Tax=Selenomonas sp. GACV-9 TaxID=3158782 RepID=UPI0008F0471D|nr:hypothetical protein SAMN02910356_00246 [Selenomonas ruminantium]